MKKVFSFFGMFAMIAMLTISCGKDPKPVTPDPGPDGPAPEPAKEYFVSPDGAGTRDGLTAENAFGMAEFRNLIFLATYNSAEPAAEPAEGEEPALAPAPVYENLDQIDGYTIHFADGKYVIPSEEADIEGILIALPGAEKQIELTLKGSDKAELSGNHSSKILAIGDQVKLNIEGLSFTGGYSLTQSGAAITVNAENGGALLNLDGTFFDDNWVNPGIEGAKCSGAAIFCANGTVYAKNCEFGVNNYGRNGGALFTENRNADVTMEKCLFKSHSYNTGGTSNNSGGKQTFKDCTFDGSYTEVGTGGALHCNAEGAVTVVENCTFKNCLGNKTEMDKQNANKATGIISFQRGDFTVKGSTFENCTSSAGAVIYIQKSDDSYEWLESIGALGKDALGNSRGSAWWPGAYQN